MPQRSYPGVHVQEIPSGIHPIVGVSTSITAFVGRASTGPIDTPVAVGSLAGFTKEFGAPSKDSTLGHAVAHFFLNGGGTALVVRVVNAADEEAPPTVADILGDAHAGTGMCALEEANLFNLLCIPPLLDEQLQETDLDELWPAAAEYCAARRAVLLIDPSPRWKDAAAAVAGAKAWQAQIKHLSNTALYFPRVVAADPSARRQAREFAPCGAVAGVIARTDARRGVWKAPAGTDASIGGIDKLSYPMNDTEQGLLNPQGVNGLRTFPVGGHLVWGARTLAGADAAGSEWKYLPVRRLALFLEESLLRGTQWVVFEPNDEPLWAKVRLNVGAFLQTLFREGAFRGSTPAEAYFVRCDASTTTQADIDAGLLNFLVGFAPLKPAEFVIVRFQQTAMTAGA